ncbi:Hypothetical predicted protein [Marmota monax]|uniref:Glutamate decarboxylase 2 n=1 Tax=Marmota monax TaxID=9995 RepID=A0A5E4AYZ1_MARMO|nr:Hypothetical predicted protein [Marmota monax]
MASPGSSFWSFGSEDGSGDPENPGTARAWCQVAQKFTGGIGNKLCALLYGDAEKPAESTGNVPPRAAAARKVACTCDQKPCNCPKANVNYAFLHSTDLLPACDGERPTLTFLQDVMDILLQYVVKSFDRSTKVIDFHYPNELLQEYNWELADQPQNLEEILVHCQTTLKYAIKTGGAISNMYAMLIARFKMFPEVKEKGMAAVPRLIAFTSEHSHFSLKKGAAALGIGTDSVILIKCDERGKMIPSDLERRILEAKQKGYVPFLVSATAGTTVYGAFDPLLAVADICKKYKIWMHVDAAWGGGLLMSRKHKWKLSGVERARRKADEVLEHLSALVKQGTQARGNVWSVLCDTQARGNVQSVLCVRQTYHVQRTHRCGDGRVFPAELVEKRANSVTWNPHKMMGVPLQCSAFLVREEGLMQSCNQMHASYLFQQDKHYDLSYDTGDKALQCGRHVDVFKLWLMWRAKGTTGFEAHIDKCLELAEYLYNIIKNREGYEMVFDGKPQHTNVCFWYIPPSLRTLEDNEERMSRLSKVAPVIKARMMEYGTTMVSYQPLGDKVNFFRMVISNPAATHQDIDFLIEEIERLGQDL